MVRKPVRWPDEVDEVIRSDLTAAAAYVTPGGGAVVEAIAPLGIAQREQGTIGFTTSLGFPRKLERIIADPRVAVAYHSREHGYSTSSSFVLMQGQATVDLKPSRERLDGMEPQGERFMGKFLHGAAWDRLLHEYYYERVFVDITVERVISWPDLHASGQQQVCGAASPGRPDAQEPPTHGMSPRVDVARAAGQITGLPHRLLAYRGADGFPVVVPVELAGHDRAGLRLVVSAGLLPLGGRHAGLLSHAYHPELVGISTRTFTGWLEVSDDGEVLYSPHTSKGFVAPPFKKALLVSNGLFAKYGMWQARRQGIADHLERLAADTARSVTRS